MTQTLTEKIEEALNKVLSEEYNWEDMDTDLREAITALKEFKSPKETPLPEEGIKYYAGSQFGPPRENK